MSFHPGRVIIELLGDKVTLAHSGDEQPTPRSLESYRRKLERSGLAHGHIEVHPEHENVRISPLVKFERSPLLTSDEFDAELHKFIEDNTRCLVVDFSVRCNSRSARQRPANARRERHEHERPLPRLIEPRPAHAA